MIDETLVRIETFFIKTLLKCLFLWIKEENMEVQDFKNNFKNYALVLLGDYILFGDYELVSLLSKITQY